MLLIGEPDKMHRELRNVKGSTDLSASSMWILVSRDSHNVFNPVFSLRMSQCVVKLQDTARSRLHSA